MEGCAVCVNCADYRLNLPVMRGALEAGAHYVDLGGLYELAARFEDEGKFGRADRLRCLARSVREELEAIGQETLPPAGEPPLALAPTAAPK